MLAKLRSAEQAIGRGQPEVAERVLDAFLNELNAFQNAGHISAENYNTLHATYLNLVNSLEGSSKARSTGKPESASTPAAGRPEVIPTPKGKK